MEVLVDEAEKHGADVTNVIAQLQHVNTAYKGSDLAETDNELLVAKDLLSKSLGGIHKTKYLGINTGVLMFKFAIYGIWPLLYGMAWFIGLGCLLIFWPVVSHAIKIPVQPIGVPAWAALVAGIGACVQIFVNVVADIKDDGIVTGDRRDWYTVLPFVSLIFGVIAYMLVQVGALSFSSTANLNTASGNQTFVLFVFAFLAGYSTDWFMGRLADLEGKSQSSTKAQSIP